MAKALSDPSTRDTLFKVSLFEDRLHARPYLSHLAHCPYYSGSRCTVCTSG